MVFVGRGGQSQALLKSLAVIFADEFIAQAETRAGKPGSSIGAIFLQASLPGTKTRAPEDILPREPANPLSSAYPFRIR